jgi:hypothetical protein
MTGGETISPGHKGRGFHPVFRGSQLRATKSRDHLDRDVIVIGTPVPHDAFTSLPLMVVKCPGLAGWKRPFSLRVLAVFVLASPTRMSQYDNCQKCQKCQKSPKMKSKSSL